MREGLPELVGTKEIAEMAGVQSSVVSNWVRRHDDFPESAYDLACGRLWIADEVRAWLAKREAQEREAALARAETLEAQAAAKLAKAQRIRAATS